MTTTVPYSALDDHELVRAYNDGDHVAFTHLVKRHRWRMMRLAKKVARDEDDSADIVQEALFNAARKLDGFRFEAQVSTWLHRLVINCASTYYRARRIEAISLDEDTTYGEVLRKEFSYDPFEDYEARIDVMLALRHVPQDALAVMLTVDMLGVPLRVAADDMGLGRKELTRLRDEARAQFKEVLAAPHAGWVRDPNIDLPPLKQEISGGTVLPPGSVTTPPDVPAGPPVDIPLAGPSCPAPEENPAAAPAGACAEGGAPPADTGAEPGDTSDVAQVSELPATVSGAATAPGLDAAEAIAQVQAAIRAAAQARNAHTPPTP